MGCLGLVMFEGCRSWPHARRPKTRAPSIAARQLEPCERMAHQQVIPAGVQTGNTSGGVVKGKQKLVLIDGYRFDATCRLVPFPVSQSLDLQSNETTTRDHTQRHHIISLPLLFFLIEEYLEGLLMGSLRLWDFLKLPCDHDEQTSRQPLRAARRTPCFRPPLLVPTTMQTDSPRRAALNDTSAARSRAVPRCDTMIRHNSFDVPDDVYLSTLLFKHQ
jgi:hypothetical protein